MKTSYIFSPAMFSAVAATVLFSSCIFETGRDRFFQTEWYSEEVPLGPFDVSTLTLEFLCDGVVTINTTGIKPQADSAQIVDIPDNHSLTGKYHPDDDSAVLEGLSATFGTHTITFIEANRNGDIVFLLWRIEDSVYPFTTALRRVNRK